MRVSTETRRAGVPASAAVKLRVIRNTRIERTGNGRTVDLGYILHRWNDNATGMDNKLMNPWEYCNSLRYGFDEDYDSPVFDDEDTSEETETNE